MVKPTSVLNSEEVADLNDRLAQEHPINDYYERSPWLVRMIEKKRLAIIREMTGDASGLYLAEIGSGGGHVLRLFPSARLTAIDVSQVFLDTARKNLVGYDVRFIKGEVDKLDLPPASLDRIICTEVLEHTVAPEAILSAMARLLKPTGVAVITVPNDPLILKLKDYVRRSPLGPLLAGRVKWGGDQYHLHQWTPADFASLLSKYLRVTDQAYAPFGALPIRACFRCVPK